MNLLDGAISWWELCFCCIIGAAAVLVSRIIRGKSAGEQTRLDAEFIEKVHNLPPYCKEVHLILVVHGFLSTPKSVENIMLALQKQAAAKKESAALNAVEIFIYRPRSNIGKTTDGILPCGQRLATEVNELLDHLTMQHNRNRDSVLDVKLSFVGNSLGGLIARASLSDILWHRSLCAINSTKLSITPKVFCSTNSPHIGISKNMFFEVPSFIEYYLAFLLGETGKDLLHFTNVLQQLTEKRYLETLQRFSKRIAYANVYRTDFQVPTETGAFLLASDSLHCSVPSEKFPLVIHAVRTPCQLDDLSKQCSVEEMLDGRDVELRMRTYSQRLDVLGWTKLFCDARPVLPSVRIPCFVRRARQDLDQEEDTTRDWTSTQLCQKYCRIKPSGSDRWYIPLAHKAMTANLEVIPGTECFYRKGLPFVEELAARLIGDILE